MLGKKLGEFRGKTTGNRVVSVDAQGPKVESSFQEAGTLLGVEVANMATYSAVPWPGGVLHGEGQGVVMTKEGEVVTWVGQGTGRFTGPGSLS